MIFHNSLCRHEYDSITWLAGAAVKGHKFIRVMGNLATSYQFLDFLIVLGIVKVDNGYGLLYYSGAAGLEWTPF